MYTYIYICVCVYGVHTRLGVGKGVICFSKLLLCAARRRRTYIHVYELGPPGDSGNPQVCVHVGAARSERARGESERKRERDRGLAPINKTILSPSRYVSRSHSLSHSLPLPSFAHSEGFRAKRNYYSQMVTFPRAKSPRVSVINLCLLLEGKPCALTENIKAASAVSIFFFKFFVRFFYYKTFRLNGVREHNLTAHHWG